MGAPHSRRLTGLPTFFLPHSLSFFSLESNDTHPLMTASSVPKELAGRGGAAFLPLTAPTPGPCPPPGLYPVLPQRSPPERRPPRSLTARQARLQAGEASRWLFPRWALTPGRCPPFCGRSPPAPRLKWRRCPAGPSFGPSQGERRGSLSVTPVTGKAPLCAAARPARRESGVVLVRKCPSCFRSLFLTVRRGSAVAGRSAGLRWARPRGPRPRANRRVGLDEAWTPRRAGLGLAVSFPLGGSKGASNRLETAARGAFLTP